MFRVVHVAGASMVGSRRALHAFGIVLDPITHPNRGRWIRWKKMNERTDIKEICTSTWSHGVTVSTLDSESSDRGSNPRETYLD